VLAEQGVEPNNTAALSLQCSDPRLHLREDFRSVRSASAQHELNVWREQGRSSEQVREPLLARNSADEYDRWAVWVNAERAHELVIDNGHPFLEVNTVIDDGHLFLIDGRIGAQDVASHPLADGDDGGSALKRGLLDPARNPIAAAQLLGFPRTKRLQAVGSNHVRHVMQQTRKMSGRVGVPGVGVHEVGTNNVLGDLQVDPERRDRCVGVGKFSWHAVVHDIGLVAWHPETTNHYLDSPSQRSHELCDMNASTPVNLWRILTSDQVDAHASTLLPRQWGNSCGSLASPVTVAYCWRMSSPKIFGIVLAGGEGKRLLPLTADRAKPAVPFGGGYRLIDFALSNLINSGLRQVVVLTQYKSHSLDRHISQTWRLSGLLDAYVASVPAQQRLGKRWFSGSADAILQSLNLIRDEKPDIVVVVGADHVYRMDFSQMVDAHIESGLGLTVAAIRQPIGIADQFGVIEVGADDATRIAAFHEKPQKPIGLSDSPDEVLASMGNYVFNADVLIDAVIRDGERSDSNHDMGGDIVPDFVSRGLAGVYDLNRNQVPGSTDRDRFYWRDVGTIESFYDAHQDLISALPIFNLYNRDWPIFSQQLNSPPAKFVRDARGYLGTMIDSIVSLGSLLSGAHIERSVLGPWTSVESGAMVVDSVVFERARIMPNAVVRKAILDKDVVVEAGATVGVDHDADRARGFTVTETGITVVGKGVHVTA